MDRSRFVAELAAQRVYCEGRSPLYAGVLRELEADAAASPPWLESLEQAWQGRRFAVGWEAAHLLLACLHHSALSGAGEALGSAASFLRRAPPVFWQQLARGFVQTNEVGRSVAWMLAAAAVFGERGLPFHLVELGASAGLNLIGDHFAHSCSFVGEDGRAVAPPAGWARRPHPVLSRTGLDQFPLRLGDPADRRWLRACVWADDRPRLERLDRAAELFLRLERQPGGPRLERCAFDAAPAWLLAKRPPRPGEGLLVFNSIATIYLDDAAYASLCQGMARALAPWGDRALWVEYERARGAAEGPLELALHRVAGGKLHTQVVASGAPRPVQMRFRNQWGSHGELF